jgi:hypothetical protein
MKGVEGAAYAARGSAGDDLVGLIAKLEAAVGPDRELDADILWLTDKRRAERVYWNAATGLPKPLPDWPRPLSGLGPVAVVNYAPAYTSSLDAALTLVPDGFQWQVRSMPTEEDFDYSAQVNWTPNLHDHAASPPIALCVAAFRARLAEHPQVRKAREAQPSQAPSQESVKP